MISLAIRPKYPTRKAIDKVIFNEDKLITIITAETKRQILPLFDTSFVAVISEDKYYPVDVDTYEEQFDLVNAGEDPTVEEDEKFGIKKLEHFFAVSDSDICSQIQEDVEVYNGIARGTLIKVANFATLGDENIDKNGFWFVVAFDKTSAEEAGYSDIKFFNTDVELADGDNYIFMGTNYDEVSAKLLFITATLTDEETEIPAGMEVDHKFKLRSNFANDEIPVIEANGKPYESLKDAFDANPYGCKIVINKSFEEPSADIFVENAKSFIIVLNNNVTVTLNKGIEVHSGSLVVNGTGTIKEKNPARGPIILTNQNEDLYAFASIGANITLEGKIGLFFTGKSYNLHAICSGHLIGSCADSFGFYANGNVKSGSLDFDGTAEGKGVGMYLAGNLDTKLLNAQITGVESGLEIRAGTLNINNCRITSTSEEEPTMKPNGSGSTSTAVALAVAQHTTKHPISVNVESGVFTGKAAFMEGNPQAIDSATENTSIAISGGTFVGEIKTLAPETDCKKFLYGGIYSVKPADMYIADDHKTSPRGNNYEIDLMTENDYFLRSLNIQPVEGEDYLFTAEYPVVDYAAAEKYFREAKPKMIPVACSSLQVGQLRGRHFDWFYNESAAIVIKTPAKDGRYASLSVSDGYNSLSKALLDSGEYNDIIRYISAATLDGVNSKGLIVNNNILPTDLGYSDHTNLAGRSICNCVVVRYLLDYAATVDEAIAILNNLDIWTYKIGDYPIIVHWHISDATGKSVIAEIIDGKIVVTEDSVMTNFYNGVDLTPHANGLERYDILKNGAESVTDVASLITLMKQVRYTEAYSDEHDIWYSEMNGKDKFGDLTIYSKSEDYAAKFAYMKEQFANRSRKTGDTWQTCHASFYNGQEKTLTVLSQEKDTEHKFTL